VGRCPLDAAQDIKAMSAQSCGGRNDVEAADRKQSPFVIKNAKIAAQSSCEAKTEVLATLRSVRERI
jgi:hypothetical protein